MTTTPRIEDRSERPYVGTRTVMPMSDFERKIPAMTQEVMADCETSGLPPAGPVFLRYHVIDMPDRMDVELGVPIPSLHPADGPVVTGTLPGGRYAVLVYTGVANGVAANRPLLDWVKATGERVDSAPVPTGEAFASRLETFLTDEKAESDRDRWEIEVAMKLEDRDR